MRKLLHLAVGVGLALMGATAVAAEDVQTLDPSYHDIVLSVACAPPGNAYSEIMIDRADAQCAAITQAVADGSLIITKSAGNGCHNIPIISLIDEDVNGVNCPATDLESFTGDMIFISAGVAVGAKALGGDPAGFVKGLGLFGG